MTEQIIRTQKLVPYVIDRDAINQNSDVMGVVGNLIALSVAIKLGIPDVLHKWLPIEFRDWSLQIAGGQLDIAPGIVEVLNDVPDRLMRRQPIQQHITNLFSIRMGMKDIGSPTYEIRKPSFAFADKLLKLLRAARMIETVAEAVRWNDLLLLQGGSYGITETPFRSERITRMRNLAEITHNVNDPAIYHILDAWLFHAMPEARGIAAHYLEYWRNEDLADRLLGSLAMWRDTNVPVRPSRSILSLLGVLADKRTVSTLESFRN